jgi:PTH1 family peptidyl-tRNA hydrolase
VNEYDDNSDRKFVVGLGNPGRKYVRTRHNIGFGVLDALRQRWSLGEGREAFSGLTWDARPTRGRNSRAVTMLAPMTYMNESGRAVRALLDFYKASPGRMLVILDDLALPLGRLRLRSDGSAGGHNGLADIIRVCGTDEFARLRLGIGPAPGVMDASDYVLSKFRDEEVEDIGAAIQLAADAVEKWIFEDIRSVMEKYNRKADG